TLGTAAHAFTSNTAALSGGAIYATAADVTVTTGTFDGNTATGGNGGAICTTGTVQVDGGSFGGTTKNTAARGGAIDAGTANINGGTFTNNEATGTTGGGAVYATTVALTGSPSFTNNTAAAGSGGAVYAGNSITIVGGTFITNKATTAVAATPANGGAIYSAGTVSVTNGSFTKNSASVTGAGDTANGGAIYANGNVTAVSGGIFSENSAINGGAVYSNGKGDLALSGGTFANNTAATNGGAIYAKGKVTVTNPNSTTNFTTVNTATAGSGGAIYSEGDIGTAGTEFRNQMAAVSGGALYARGDVTVTSGTFSSNKTTDTAATAPNNDYVGGGAIYAEVDVTIASGTGDVNGNSNANGASTNSGGGAIYARRNVTIDGGRFYSNSSATTGENSGGGVVWSGGEVDVKGGNFASPSTQKNTAARNGGAIYAVTAINVTNEDNEDKKFTFSNQQALNGGALYSAGTIEAKNVIFLANVATGSDTSDGGATYSDGVSTLTNCFFNGNKATRNGGASLAKGITATYVTWYSNSVSNANNSNGGAVSVNSGTSNTIANCVFSGNTSVTSGGALYVVNTTTKLTVTDSVFWGNETSGTGGAVSTSTTPAELILLRCTFQSENKATGSGGAANIEAAKFQIANCTFHKNSTEGSGGALQLAGGTGGSAVVFNTIASNKATNNGGGISSTATFTLGANILTDNAASLGDDIYASGGTITSRGYTFFTEYGEGASETASWTSATHVTSNSADDVSSGNTFNVFFGDGVTPAVNSVGANMPPAVGASDPITTADDGLVVYTLNTLALRDATEELNNPAQAVVPLTTAKSIYNSIGNAATSYTDERGVRRPSTDGSTWDAGAYDTLEGGNGGGGGDAGDDGSIKRIRISGLPNTLRTVGQTTSLFVVGYDIHNNIVNRDVAVDWDSDSSAVVIYSSGNIYANHIGKATITAKMKSNASITDSVELNVTEDASASDSNLHPIWWNRLGLQQLTDQGMSLAIASTSSTVTTSAFQDAFQDRWGATVSLIPNSESVSAASPAAVPALTENDLKPGVKLSISGLEKGNILPLEYSWTFDYDQLSKLLDRNVTSLPSAAELAKFVRVDFENLRSVRVPVIDGSTGGTFNVATAQFGKVGVSAVDAALTGALKVQQASGGATIRLTAYLANVDDAANSGAQLVQRLLVVPDGVADNLISGTMWMSKKAASSSSSNEDNSSGGGGGGGCDTVGLGLSLIFLALPLLRRKKAAV
ncbi:MAG: hypothetical protein IJ702_02830, partial [Fretibacterium sp.]|nr:hypothetical protein [Fretibacterium sp.]